ncbi:hypothetical protein BofuT4_uP087290.1 [Botrytis cinerea T4]|uniref:Uncharacterized protein n=1 Tax=Botryotinia fuckeliana (strain T4) TaxID=999810 RepID=G2YGC7_BOTF4|nr:hypothetical protein BofuT4_uP087290.1 [Botrytis cinerea T4]
MLHNCIPVSNGGFNFIITLRTFLYPVTSKANHSIRNCRPGGRARLQLTSQLLEA